MDLGAEDALARRRLELVPDARRARPEQRDPVAHELRLDAPLEEIAERHARDRTRRAAVVERELIAARIRADVAAEFAVEPGKPRRADAQHARALGVRGDLDARAQRELERERRHLLALGVEHQQDPAPDDSVGVGEEIAEPDLRAIGEEGRPRHAGQIHLGELLDHHDAGVREHRAAERLARGRVAVEVDPDRPGAEPPELFDRAGEEIIRERMPVGGDLLLADPHQRDRRRTGPRGERREHAIVDGELEGGERAPRAGAEHDRAHGEPDREAHGRARAHHGERVTPPGLSSAFGSRSREPVWLYERLSAAK